MSHRNISVDVPLMDEIEACRELVAELVGSKPTKISELRRAVALRKAELQKEVKLKQRRGRK